MVEQSVEGADWAYRLVEDLRYNTFRPKKEQISRIVSKERPPLAHTHDAPQNKQLGNPSSASTVLSG